MDTVQPREPLATICHGDYLRNNIAFKYDENVSIELNVGYRGCCADFLHANADAETKKLSKLQIGVNWRYSNPSLCFQAKASGIDVFIPLLLANWTAIAACNRFCSPNSTFVKQPPHAPIKAMMFDFQTLRYASPMIDLATFLANSTGTDVRSTHFSFIFKTYHEEVIKTMMFTMKKFRQEIPDAYRYGVESDESF